MKLIDKLDWEQISNYMKALKSKRWRHILTEYLEARMERAARDILLKKTMINGTMTILNEEWADILRREILTCKWLLNLPNSLTMVDKEEVQEDIEEEDTDIMADVLTQI